VENTQLQRKAAMQRSSSGASRTRPLPPPPTHPAGAGCDAVGAMLSCSHLLSIAAVGGAAAARHCWWLARPPKTGLAHTPGCRRGRVELKWRQRSQCALCQDAEQRDFAFHARSLLCSVQVAAPYSITHASLAPVRAEVRSIELRLPVVCIIPLGYRGLWSDADL